MLVVGAKKACMSRVCANQETIDLASGQSTSHLENGTMRSLILIDPQ